MVLFIGDFFNLGYEKDVDSLDKKVSEMTEIKSIQTTLRYLLW